MEFRLDDGQLGLQQTVGRFCSDRFPPDALGSREEAPLHRPVWAEMARLGIFGLLLPEGRGGSGLGPVDAAIVFEQLGRHLVPGPVLWTLLAAPHVAGAASGDVLVTGVDARAVVDGSAVVEHAAGADVVLVVDDDGLVVHRAADLPAITPLRPLDPLAPVARVTGLATGGDRLGDAGAAAALRLLGTTLSAAELIGVGSRALDVARDYALERHQFGAPIGSFQAVKHLLADMYVRTMSAQSAGYAAAAVLADGGGEASRAAARAKLLASDAAIRNASTAIQVLGGMGFTWDMLPNYLLKRAWALENDFGTVEEHEVRLGSSPTMLAATEPAIVRFNI